VQLEAKIDKTLKALLLRLTGLKLAQDIGSGRPQEIGGPTRIEGQKKDSGARKAMREHER